MIASTVIRSKVFRAVAAAGLIITAAGALEALRTQKEGASA